MAKRRVAAKKVAARRRICFVPGCREPITAAVEDMELFCAKHLGKLADALDRKRAADAAKAAGA